MQEKAEELISSGAKIYIETFGTDSLEPEDPVLDAFIAEAAII